MRLVLRNVVVGRKSERIPALHCSAIINGRARERRGFATVFLPIPR